MKKILREQLMCSGKHRHPARGADANNYHCQYEDVTHLDLQGEGLLGADSVPTRRSAPLSLDNSPPGG
jgi:hypothetical protein